MFFEYAVTVPAETPAADPLEQEIPLSAGTVTLVSVQFPPGCRGEVRASIWRMGHQVWPVNLDGWIAADGAIVQWPEDYDLADEPFSFVVKLWAPSTRYSHTITFRFALLSLEAAAAQRAEPGLLRRIAQFLTGGV